MHKSLMSLGAAALLAIGGGSAALGATAAAKCEAAKVQTAGKYAFCRLKADAKAIKQGAAPDYGKCDAKYALKWGLVESKGGGACPVNGDEAAIQTQASECTDALTAAIGGTPPAGCPVDLAQCQADLGACGGDLGTCNADLGTCSGDLGTCTGSLSTCSGDLSTCNSGLSTCTTDLGTVQGDLAACSGDLGTCQSDLGQSQADLGDCTTDLGHCTGDLGDCAADLADCSADLGTCPADLAACQAEPKGQRMRTGQTQCWDASNVVTPCAGTGQDGDHLKGLTVSFTDNGNGTITDNRTGLMWEKHAQAAGINNWATTYTWHNAFRKVRVLNGDATGCIGAGNPDACCSGAGTGTCSAYLGYTDWRLPNINELHSLLNFGTVSPAVHAPFHTGCVASCTVTTCSCTQSSNYWSATTQHSIPTQAFFVGIGNGNVGLSGKTTGFHYVRAVRGGS